MPTTPRGPMPEVICPPELAFLFHPPRPFDAGDPADRAAFVAELSRASGLAFTAHPDTSWGLRAIHTGDEATGELTVDFFTHTHPQLSRRYPLSARPGEDKGRSRRVLAGDKTVGDLAAEVAAAFRDMIR